MKRFLHLTDVHYGFERKHGHKYSLHDQKAMDVALAFAADFKPDVVILGGDILDCGPISHHNKNKPGRTEGLRLLTDGQECRQLFLKPLEDICKSRVYITGNHEDWVNDFVEENPAVEHMVGLDQLLELDAHNWNLLPQGSEYKLGKLSFVHGDQLAGGEHVAKAAVITYERSIRFGHHHTYQVYTKSTPTTDKLGKTGVAVPCLCTKEPKYGEGKANRWVQGVNFGYVFPDGTYHDQVNLIVNGRLVANGKTYKS